MTEREAFLQMLAENEDDATTRLVYADWLDDCGEYEEAERQRKWPAAKEWLVRFCQENSRREAFSYEDLLEFGQAVAQDQTDAGRTYLDSEAMWEALRAHRQEFWNNWSVVTGLRMPAAFAQKDFHSYMCCPTEIYFWFGPPDEDPSYDDA